MEHLLHRLYGVDAPGFSFNRFSTGIVRKDTSPTNTRHEATSSQHTESNHYKLRCRTESSRQLLAIAWCVDYL